jgi:hypothetical protein
MTSSNQPHRTLPRSHWQKDSGQEDAACSCPRNFPTPIFLPPGWGGSSWRPAVGLPSPPRLRAPAGAKICVRRSRGTDSAPWIFPLPDRSQSRSRAEPRRRGAKADGAVRPFRVFRVFRGELRPAPAGIRFRVFRVFRGQSCRVVLVLSDRSRSLDPRGPDREGHARNQDTMATAPSRLVANGPRA